MIDVYSMAHPHSKLLEDLGGTATVARELGITANVVWNWAQRGIAWPWRAEVAALALKRGKSVPAGFMSAARGRAA